MKTDIYNFILRLEEKVKMNCRLVRLLSLSTLFMIPFAFGIVNAQTDAEAAAANSNSEVVINEFENVSEQDTAYSFTENQNDSDVDLNSNQEVLLTEESKNSVQASYDEEDAVSETEKSVSLRVESINGILRITDNTGKFYKGMHTIGTKTYCADENARVIVDRFFIYNGRAYISDKTGAIRTGVVFSREYGYYYYCNPAEGGAIKPDAGFVEWNGNRYYVNKGGKIARGGFTLINGRAYIIGDDAVIKTGVQFSDQYGYYYYCNPDEGGAIKPDAGFVEWNVNRYYVNKGGKIARGGFTLINGRAYIIGDDVVIKTGVQFSDQYGYYYYCNPDEGGAIKPDAGFVEWNGNRYYVNKGGKIAANGFTIIHGTAYIIGKNGVIKTGVVYSSQYGYCYYCDPENGGAIKVDAGYVEWEGKQYYVNKGGKIVPTVEFKAAALMDEIGHSLFNAYKYLAKQPYYRMYVSTSKGKEWFADFGFSRGEGNCYVKTAMLYYMAKSMGYDNIRAVDGYCLGYGGERLPHGWLEYYENGKTYIIDPTFENEVGRNGYMIQYGQKGTWKYLPNESRTWTE